jgi:hypothetical protein
MDICPQPTQNDFTIAEQVNKFIMNDVPKITRSGRSYGGKNKLKKRTRKMKGGGSTHCHMICAAIIFCIMGGTAAGVYYFYGAVAGILEKAAGKGTLCSSGAWGFGENQLRGVFGQPSCKEAADNYYNNLNTIYATIAGSIGTVTVATLYTQYGNLYNSVVNITGCTTTEVVPVTGTNSICNPTSGGNPQLNKTTSNMNNEIKPIIQPTKESMNLLDKLEVVLGQKKAGKKRITKRKKYK